MQKLNLGCGLDHRSGYVNLDVDPAVEPDVIHDLKEPLPYEKNSTDEILLKDVLEHLMQEDAHELLRECTRVLAIDGEIHIRVPNVHAILDEFGDREDVMMLFLYGNTQHSGIWGTHKYGYTPDILRGMIEDLPLRLVESKQYETNFHFTLRRVVMPPRFNYVVKGSGRMPRDLVEKDDPQGEVIYVCTDIPSFILWTVWAQMNAQRVIWHLENMPSAWHNNLIGKTILRPLSRFVQQIYVESVQEKEYAKSVLQFSHLRIKLR